MKRKRTKKMSIAIGLVSVFTALILVGLIMYTVRCTRLSTGYHVILGFPEIKSCRLEIRSMKGESLARILLVDAMGQPVDSILRGENPLKVEGQAVRRGDYQLPLICELSENRVGKFKCPQVQLHKRRYSSRWNIYQSEILPEDVLEAIEDNRVLCLVIRNDDNPIDQAVMSILGPE